MEIQDMAGGHQYINSSIIKETIIHSNTNEYKQEEYNSGLPSATEVKQNTIKIVNVMSIPNQSGLWQKPTEQEGNLQHPKQATDSQENTKQDINLKLDPEHHIQYNNLQEYPEVEHIKSERIMQPCIEVKTEINEQINPPYHNIIRVKEEAFDYENDMDTNKSDNILSSTNVYDLEITIKDEFAERILSQNNVTNTTTKQIIKTNNVGKACKGKPNGILKKKKVVDLIMKNVTPSDKHFMLKCTVCYKAFLGNDAYNEHMKKHTNQDKSLGIIGPSSGVVLKVGDPLSNKCTIAKVKRVKSKAKTKEEDYEEILAKYLDAIKDRNENPYDSDSSTNNNYSAQSNYIKAWSENPNNSDSSTKNNNSAQSNNIKAGSENPNNSDSSTKNNNSAQSNNIKAGSENPNNSDSSTNNNNSAQSNNIKARSENPNNSDSSTNNNNNSAQSNNVQSNNVQSVSNIVNVENKDIHTEPELNKVTEVKPIKKKRSRRQLLTMSVTYKKCDDNCTNDESCTNKKPKRDFSTRYSCTQCKYNCRYKKLLETHMLKHICFKGFSCHICKYKCLEKSHLDQHLRIHTQTKKYSCNYCEYDCIQRSHLDQHMHTHTQLNPYSCNHCDYKCIQRSDLDQHMRTHAGVTPFSCMNCDYVCVERAHLNKHIIRVHTNVCM